MFYFNIIFYNCLGYIGNNHALNSSKIITDKLKKNHEESTRILKYCK